MTGFFGDQPNTFFDPQRTEFRLQCGARVLVDHSVMPLRDIIIRAAERFIADAGIFGIYEHYPSFYTQETPYSERMEFTGDAVIVRHDVDFVIEDRNDDHLIEFRAIVTIRRMGHQDERIAVSHAILYETIERWLSRGLEDEIASLLIYHVRNHVTQWAYASNRRFRGELQQRTRVDDGSLLELERAIWATNEYARQNREWLRRINQGINQELWELGTRTYKEKENEKAKELLLSCLTKQQKNQYKKNNWFIVRGSETGLTYRVRRAKQINVDLMDGDVVVKRLCTVPDEYVPIEDHLLAQKLMLETDEMDFLSRALEWSA